jgi:hypothetical protein
LTSWFAKRSFDDFTSVRAENRLSASSKSSTACVARAREKISPAALAPQRREAAFSMDDVTFGGWYEPARGWTLRGTLEPFHEELSILTGAAEVYRAYAASYFEIDVPLDAIEHVLAGKPLDAALVARVAPERSLESLQADVEEIGY